MAKIKLLKKKECTVLTWQGKLLAGLAAGGLLTYLFFQTPLYLSINEPVYGEYLVLDGELPDHTIIKAIEIFDTSDYSMVITTGGNLITGYYLSGQKTMSEVTRATFLQLGFDSSKIIAIHGETSLTDRTYNSGVSLKIWMEKQNVRNARIDILTEGCHARRSRYLFQKALGDSFTVGVIAVEDKSYDIRRWWKSSKGARTVISETIAWIYVRLFFR